MVLFKIINSKQNIQMPSNNKYEQTSDTAQRMLYEVVWRMATITEHKQKFKAPLGDIEVKFKNYDEAVEFIYTNQVILENCEEANTHLDNFTEWLFDNSDGMGEGDYIKLMDVCKYLKETAQTNKDDVYLSVAIGLACKHMMLLDEKLKNMSEKKQKKEKKKAVKWNKLEMVIADGMKNTPERPIDEFLEDIQYISYSNINLSFEENCKYVKDIGMALYNRSR